jgi:RHS repeat-associated protein
VPDHLGTTIALTNGSGGIVERQQQDAFGQSAGSSLTRYGFTGREQDRATGLIYYRARWYDPQLGRFISEDPIGTAGGINLFEYAHGDPMMYRELHGLGHWEPG